MLLLLPVDGEVWSRHWLLVGRLLDSLVGRSVGRGLFRSRLRDTRIPAGLAVRLPTGTTTAVYSRSFGCHSESTRWPGGVRGRKRALDGVKTADETALRARVATRSMMGSTGPQGPPDKRVFRDIDARARDGDSRWACLRITVSLLCRCRLSLLPPTSPLWPCPAANRRVIIVTTTLSSA